MRFNSSDIDESSSAFLSGKAKEHLDTEIGGHVNTVTRLRIANLCCAGEERIIRSVIGKLPGIQELSINVIGKYIVVKHCQMVCCSPGTMIKDKLNDKRLGASIQEVGEDCSEEEASDIQLDILQLLFVISLVALFAVALSFELCEINELATQIAYVACIWLGVAPVLYSAYIALQRRTIDINILILVAIGGAVSIFEFSDAALVVVLFNLSRLVECEVLRWVRKTASIARGSIPKIAMLPSGMTVPLRSLQVGDVVVFRAGEMITVDGQVVKGSAVVDESAMTGEAKPLNKELGSVVTSGTVIQNGYIEVTVKEKPENSSMQRLQNIIGDIQAQNDNFVSIIDEFAVYWTPFVLITAIGLLVVTGLTTGEWHLWVMRSLAVLVLACPCSIVVAVPIPCVIAIAAAARRGVLIKGKTMIEKICKVDTIAMDKTGTLTDGFFKVINKVVVYENDSPQNEEASSNPLLIAASLENKCAHPLANAVVADYTGCVAESELNLLDVHNVGIIPGIGVEGHVILSSSGSRLHCVVGNEKLLSSSDGQFLYSPETLSKAETFMALYKNTGATILIVVIDNKLRLLIAVADRIRSDAKRAIQRIKSSGISNIYMLTGDQQDTAVFVAKAAGIDASNVRSRLSPVDKLKWITSMKNEQDVHRKVLMIGDGINDAAALAEADVGIAMGSGCSAMASIAASVIITFDNLVLFSSCIILCKLVKSIINFNILVSVGIKITAICVAVMGHLSLWEAILVDMGSLFIVTLTGLIPLACSDFIWNHTDSSSDDKGNYGGIHAAVSTDSVKKCIDRTENEALMRNNRIDSRLKSTESSAPVYVCVPCDVSQQSGDDLRGVFRNSRSSRQSINRDSRAKSRQNSTTSRLKRDILLDGKDEREEINPMLSPTSHINT